MCFPLLDLPRVLFLSHCTRYKVPGINSCFEVIDVLHTTLGMVGCQTGQYNYARKQERGGRRGEEGGDDRPTPMAWRWSMDAA